MHSTSKLNLKQKASTSPRDSSSSILFYHQPFLKQHSKQIFKKETNLRHIKQSFVSFYILKYHKILCFHLFTLQNFDGFMLLLS